LEDLLVVRVLRKNAGGGGPQESQREVEKVEDPSPMPMPP